MSERWLDALAGDAAPLVAVARRWLTDRSIDEAGVPSGTAGMAWLAAELDAWLADDAVTETDDHRFVEGAGALLGLLLLAHTRDGAFVERDGRALVRLGADGWFDPFACMERVLEADAPRRELARSVALAEAEARGEGPVARVVRAFGVALERARPDLAIAERFAARVWLTGSSEVEVDLGRTVEATSGESQDAVDAAVRKVVSMLPGAVGETTRFADVRSRLVPRLVGAAFLRSLAGAAAGTATPTLSLMPLGHGVSVALLIAYDDRARYVRARELDDWGVTPSDAQHIAIENLAVRSAKARFARIDTPEGPLIVARSGDGLDAARLVLPTLHSVLAPELGATALVAVPHRDALIAAPDGHPALATALRARAHDDAARAPHPITSELFAVDAAGLRPIS